MEYTLILSQEKVQQIIDVLVEKPFKDVSNIISDILRQVKEQQESRSNDTSGNQST